MKGIKYRVRYVEGLMSYVHGDYYESDVIYIPELRVTINYLRIIYSEVEDYSKPINDVLPKKLGEIEIDDDDVEKIKTIVNTEKIEKEIIKKYIGDKK